MSHSTTKRRLHAWKYREFAARHNKLVTLKKSKLDFARKYLKTQFWEEKKDEATINLY